ncbi:phospholipase A2 inhibitor gamma subunit B, partial [Pogona vitticeps]
SSTVDGQRILTTEKGCENSEICASTPVDLYLGQGKSYRAHLYCCTGDACGNLSPEWKPMILLEISRTANERDERCVHWLTDPALPLYGYLSSIFLLVFLLSVPPEQVRPNGLQCPACYSWTQICSSEMVNCTGSDTYCFGVLSRIYTSRSLK